MADAVGEFGGKAHLKGRENVVEYDVRYVRKKANLACGGEFYPGLLLHLRLLSYLALQAVNLLLLLPEKEKRKYISF